MNTLDQAQLFAPSPPASLCLANQLAVAAVTSAMAAIYHLDSIGATVLEIEIFTHRPVIRIDPPPGGSFVRGALHKRITERGVTRTVYVTTCHGTTVEWVVIRQGNTTAAQA